ncbi:amino acid adenylation domain-containing protein [Kribbella sp. NPDC050470]|uniref:amino acid adenylation domain-containing protein n=1 Tax=unclassified Kribbella TaxID=2644121 RepID=UPI0037BC9DA0
MRSSVDRPAISTGPALMIPAGYPRDLPSALLRAARDFGGAGVVEIGPDGRETKLDFPTLLELAARILAGLRANGVRAGDPAVVHVTEPVGFFAAFWACTLGGIRPLLMAPSAGGDRTEEGRERLRKVTDLLGWTVLIGRPSDLPNDLGLPVLDPDALAGHEPTSEFHRPAADDVAVLMTSSGTSTGAPKIVQLTHRGLVEFAAGTPAMLPVRPGQTTLNWLPLDRSGAFLLYHLLPVFTGCTNIHVNTDWVLANPLRWLDLMDQHRVNHSWSPNFGYRLATQAIAGEPDRHWDLSALRSLVSGGEQITVPVMSEFLRLTNRFGVVPETFVAAWGMTETVTGITFGRPGLTPNVHRVRIPPTGVVEWVDQRPSSGKVAVARPGKTRAEAPGVLSLVSVGAPAPGTTVRIVAPNGAVLPEGRIGQLQVASARVTPGYLGNLEADRDAFPIGNWPARKWLATGDQGFITGGQVVITGRDSERIIMSGKLYYAHDIETVASSVVGAEHGLIAACGVADPERGTDRLVVFYALTPESIPGMDQAIRSLIQGRLGLEAEVVGVPRRDFPTTPGGKILRPLLRQRWLDGTLETPAHPYVEPAGANAHSGPTGEGPHATTPGTPISLEEDPAERTQELPVVRLAWKRTLQQSIPTPPQRPTLGANRTPTPAPETPSAPAEPTATAAEPGPTAAEPTPAAVHERSPSAGGEPTPAAVHEPGPAAESESARAADEPTPAAAHESAPATSQAGPTAVHEPGSAAERESAPTAAGEPTPAASEADHDHAPQPASAAFEASSTSGPTVATDPGTNSTPDADTTRQPDADANGNDESDAYFDSTAFSRKPSTDPEATTELRRIEAPILGTDPTADVQPTAEAQPSSEGDTATEPNSVDGPATEPSAEVGPATEPSAEVGPATEPSADVDLTADVQPGGQPQADPAPEAGFGPEAVSLTAGGPPTIATSAEATPQPAQPTAKADNPAVPAETELTSDQEPAADPTTTELAPEPSSELAEPTPDPTAEPAEASDRPEQPSDPDADQTSHAAEIESPADADLSARPEAETNQPTAQAEAEPTDESAAQAEAEPTDESAAQAEAEPIDKSAEQAEAEPTDQPAEADTEPTDESGEQADAEPTDESAGQVAVQPAEFEQPAAPEVAPEADAEDAHAAAGEATAAAELPVSEQSHQPAEQIASTAESESPTETDLSVEREAETDQPAAQAEPTDEPADPVAVQAAEVEPAEPELVAEPATGDDQAAAGEVPAELVAGPAAEVEPAERELVAEPATEDVQAAASEGTANAESVTAAQGAEPSDQAAEQVEQAAGVESPVVDASSEPEAGADSAAVEGSAESAERVAVQAGEVEPVEAELVGESATDDDETAAGGVTGDAESVAAAHGAEQSDQAAEQVAEAAEVEAPAGVELGAEPEAGADSAAVEGSADAGDESAERVAVQAGEAGDESAEQVAVQGAEVASSEPEVVSGHDAADAGAAAGEVASEAEAVIAGQGAEAGEEAGEQVAVLAAGGEAAAEGDLGAESEADGDGAVVPALAQSGESAKRVAAEPVAEPSEQVAGAAGAGGVELGTEAGEEAAGQAVGAAGVVGEAASDEGVSAAGSVGGQKKKAAVVGPVAVVGLAGRFPGAEGLEQFWDNLVGGVGSVRRFTPDEVRLAGGHPDDGMVAVSGVLDHVESFDARFFGLGDREAELMDPALRLFLEVCYQALEHGGYAGTSSRVGVFAGSGMNLYAKQNQSRDSLAARVAYRLGLTGPAIGVQSAWSSSLVAVHLACQALRSGDADLALAGAAAVQVPQATGYRPSPESILSPSGQVRAFDATADGTVAGNGVAAVLLKRLDQAVADGDTVYAVIRGTAVSSEDAPAGNQVDLIERALERAGFAADSLSYIEANAIGSTTADSAEVKALTTALRRHTDKVGFCTLGSVKPNIGHLDSAAGMAGLIKTILMLQHRMLVPTINYSEPNPQLDLDGSPFVIGTEARDWEAGTTLRAGVSALDAGGTNAHVILEEAPRQIRRGDDGPVVLPLSAPDLDALADLVELYRTDLGHGTGHRLIDLAGTAALGRPAYRHRIAVAGSSEAELVDALATAQAAEVPRGGPGPLGYAFTGQGAARRGMAAGLAARFPVFRSVLDECDRVYAEEFGGSLLDLLLTPAGSSEGVWPTETAQPALFAFELALARLWQSFGVQPALVVGHSVGEYAALCVAGALSLADGVRLTAKRGELMQRGTVPGAMVAVRADADRVRELAQTPGVEIAAGNGPQSFVLTGSEVIVGQLAAQLDQLQVAWQRLDVDRAFHSSLVDPILKDFAAIVREITLKPLRTPMVSSWSGELLESGTVLDGDYLVGQLRQPVLFGDAVEAVTAAGCRRFIELGPDAVLSPAGRRIAPNSTWIPAQRLGQDPVLATMNGLAELYEQGTEIAWSKVYGDGGRVPLPTYPFRRVHHPIDNSAAVAEGAEGAGRLSPFERAARAQTVVFEPASGTGPAVKKIPLDPPVEPSAAEAVEVDASESEADVADESVFALPAETHSVDADYLAQAGSLSGDEVSAEVYRASLDVVLDLTCEELSLDPYDLTVDHTFAELGATAESMAPVVEEINARFEVSLTAEELLGSFSTPHKLATAVAIQAPKPEPVVIEEVVAEGDESPETPAVVDSVAPATDARTALAVLGTGLAELAAKVDEAAAATSEAELPGSGMAALMSQQLRVAGQLVDGVTKLMREQLALLEPAQESAKSEAQEPDESADDEDPEPAAEPRDETQADQQAGAGEQTETAKQAGVAELAAVGGPVPVAELSEEEREARRRDLAYWDVALAGAEPLVLVGDRPVGEQGVGSVKKELAEDLGGAIFVFSRERKVSPLMVMLAAVGTVLGRFAAQDDVTIGTAPPRPQGDTSTTPQRALPIRVDLSGEPDLGVLAHRVRDVTTGAFDHAGTDLAVLERDPLFQVLVEFEDGDTDLPKHLDLRLRLTHHEARITCTADYRTGMFEQSTIDRLLAYLEAVLRRATTQPHLRLPDLMQPIESDLQTLHELEGDIDPAGPIGRVRRNAVVAGELSGLHTLFEQQVARTPDAIALIQGNRELTYAELDRRSNAVAWQLVDLGVKPGQLVAVRVARGTELVVAVLAVLKSGAAYLPLDPGVPESRWAFMVDDSSAVALVGDDAALADRLGLRLVPVAAVDGDPRSQQAPPVRSAADDVAYCIYTSGSNGNPKGVLVPHRGPVNLIRHYLATRRSLRTLQWTSFGFDVHVQEMFTALASGAPLVLIGEDDRYDPDAVIAALRDHQVERLFMAFSPLTALLATMRRLPELPALREIVAGGEAMVLTHKVRDFLDAHPGCRLFNEYGPVEASIVTTIHEVDPAEDRPSIGRPVEGVVVRLLDQALRPVPVGAVGEIHLGGAAVAQGYIGRPDETERAFVPDPGHPGGRLYRSRDLGRWRADGTLEYLGRADDQVKIRGHRVEPGETEHVLADQPGVVDAVVVACADPAGDTCLLGYVVLEDSDPAVLARLMLDLGKELPIYLVPADLIPIEELPLDDNGRLDRSRLPEPEWLKA